MASYDNIAGNEQDADSHPENSHNYTQMAMNVGDSSNASVVQYEASHASNTIKIGNDLGAALKLMAEHRKQYPDSPAKMGASYDK